MGLFVQQSTEHRLDTLSTLSLLHHSTFLRYGQDRPLCAEYVIRSIMSVCAQENVTFSKESNSPYTTLSLPATESDSNATAVAIFGAIGAAVIALKALSFLRVLVDVFLRSGINVCESRCMPPLPPLFHQTRRLIAKAFPRAFTLGQEVWRWTRWLGW